MTARSDARRALSGGDPGSERAARRATQPIGGGTRLVADGRLPRHRRGRLRGRVRLVRLGARDDHPRGPGIGEEGAEAVLLAQRRDHARQAPGEVGDHQVLRGVARDERDGVHGALLADPIDAADPLFEPRRVPGQLVVHDDPAAPLKIQSLGRRVGGQQEPAGLVEACLHGGALTRRQPAMQLQRGGKRGRELQQRVAILGEDDDGLVADAVQQPAQAPLLRVHAGGRVRGIDQRGQPALLERRVGESRRAERGIRQLVADVIVFIEQGELPRPGRDPWSRERSSRRSRRRLSDRAAAAG